MPTDEIENMLIQSVHSDKAADRFFLEHTSSEELFGALLNIVETSESGDARMEGAYWISKFDEALLAQAEERLLVLMDCGWDSVAVHIMIALSRIKSRAALTKIIDERIRPHLYWESVALCNYLL